MKEMDSYSQRAEVSWLVVGTYAFLMGLILLLWVVRDLIEFEAVLLVGVLGIYLARILSVHYVISGEHLTASRLFGSRRVELTSIRKANPTSLRELSPVSWTGGWGWRSRMWTPVIGAFDNLSTVHNGLMVYGDGVPFLISPLDREAFLTHLDERCGHRLSAT